VKLFILVILTIAYASLVPVAEAENPCQGFGKISDLFFFRTQSRGLGGIRFSRTHNGGLVDDSYALTNRTLSEFQMLANFSRAAHFYSPNALRGRRILDTGSGSGAFVRDLRAHGIEAYGIDLVPPLDPLPGLIRGDATLLPFANGSFDHVYSHYNIFFKTYLRPETRPFRLQALREFHRVLKPGGSLRIALVDAQSRREIDELMAIFPGFRETPNGDPGIIELERLNLP
jgi:SAM-dependent methyltransferase